MSMPAPPTAVPPTMNCLVLASSSDWIGEACQT